MREGNTQIGTISSLMAFAWNTGISIIVPIFLLSFLGRWLDKVFGTYPVLFLAGMFLSVFVSLYIVFRNVSRVLDVLGKDASKDDDNKNKKPDGNNSRTTYRMK